MSADGGKLKLSRKAVQLDEGREQPKVEEPEEGKTYRQVSLVIPHPGIARASEHMHLTTGGHIHHSDAVLLILCGLARACKLCLEDADAWMSVIVFRPRRCQLVRCKSYVWACKELSHCLALAQAAELMYDVHFA